MSIPLHSDIFRFVSMRAVNTPERDARSRRFVFSDFSEQDESFLKLRDSLNAAGTPVGTTLQGQIAAIGQAEGREQQIQNAIVSFDQSSPLRLAPATLLSRYPKRLSDAYLWHRDNNAKRDVSKNQFSEVIEQALATSIPAYLAESDYYARKLALWENLIAEYLAPKRGNGRFLSDLVDMTRWFWILEKLADDNALLDGQEIYEAMHATVVLPEYILTLLGPAKSEEPKTPDKPQKDKKPFSTKELDTAIEEIQHAYRSKTTDYKHSRRSETDHTDIVSLSEKYYRSLSKSTLQLLSEFELISNDSLQIDHALERIQIERERLYDTKSFGGPNYIQSNGRNFEFDDLCYHYTPPDPCAPYNNEGIQLPSRIGLIRTPGIADLKVIRSVLLKYQIGELAHVENVLNGETKTREFNTMRRMEETLVTEEETTVENEKESQTTDRFELEREMSRIAKEDMKIDTGVKVTATYGPVSIDTHFDFQYSTSKEDSNKTATKNSQETVNKALSRVIERRRTQRTVTTIVQTDDKNKHRLKNETGNNIHGLYYWIDKYYLSKVVNYGKRLMFEFVVPEPAAFYLFSKTKKADGAKLPPKHPSAYGVNSFNDINEANYFILSSVYGVQDIIPPPPLTRVIATTLKQDKNPAGKDDDDAEKNDIEFTVADVNERIKVPDGYLGDRADISFAIDKTTKDEVTGRDCDGGILGSGILENCKDITTPVQSFHILISNKHLRPTGGSTSPIHNILLNNEDGVIPVSIKGMSRHFVANVEVLCRRTDRLLREWKNRTFNSIVASYNALQQKFEDAERASEIDAGIVIEGNNPELNRRIEKEELKKHCIEMMTGQRFESFDAMRNNVPPFGYPEFSISESFAEGNYIQFFEQAFEWEQLTYVFYPYFWGKKPFWIRTKKVTDPDPIFNNFLQAGAARVLVPARPGFEYDVVTFFASGGTKLWGGKQAPIPGDPHWLPIIDEIKEQQGQFKGGAQEGDPWIYKVPTSLIYLDNINAALVDNSANYPNDVAVATASQEFN